MTLGSLDKPRPGDVVETLFNVCDCLRERTPGVGEPHRFADEQLNFARLSSPQGNPTGAGFAKPDRVLPALSAL